MIDLVGFGTLTAANKTEKANHVSNPISSSTDSFSARNFFSQSKDRREFQTEEQVAYANPFSFESLFGGSDNSTVSAFDA
ncbi:hypothetical protein IJ732_00560 [bacterium]|nr:hypothetical protein [bacterium]